MRLEDAQVKSILLKWGYVTAEDMAEAEAAAINTRQSLLQVLLAKELVTYDLVGQAFAEEYGVVYFDLNSKQLSREYVIRLPEELARRFSCVFLYEEGEDVWITTDMPANPELRQVLEGQFLGTRIRLTYSLGDDIEKTFVFYDKGLQLRIDEFLDGGTRRVPELLHEIFVAAFKKAASDIHFEPQLAHVTLRFRIDGVLHEQGILPKDFYANILNLVKVESRLRIDEHQSPQDGSLRVEWQTDFIDLRVSIIPIVDGEKIVMRVLSSYVADLGLHHLGLSPSDRELFEAASRKPFGMILVAGPTGSGKTTTLYGLLKMVNQTTVNVTTIEDPVEYKMLGINQIQVNAQTGLTFARGLRSIVRQDPDVILVGEIRDGETAEIAVNAALTGHLLLSTFHANDAATAIPRLFDMGIEPFLLASTLELIVSQRLVRRLCDQCRYSYQVAAQDRRQSFGKAERLLPPGDITLYAGKGCSACNESGFQGRVAVFEVIRATPELRDLVMHRPSSQDIWRLARSQGAQGMFEDGLTKVLEGMTTLEELLRVTDPSYVVE